MNFVNEDCFTLMSRLEDNSVDLILTDPPYLRTQLDFDKNELDIKKLSEEFARILKKDSWCLVWFTHAKDIDRFSDHLEKVGEMIWIKSNSSMQSRHAIRPRQKHETVHIFKNRSTPLEEMRDLTNTEPYPTLTRKNSGINKFENARMASSLRIENFGKEDILEHKQLGYTQFSSVFFYSQLGYVRWHPTQKPTKILEVLVQKFSSEQDVVFDPFSGSGSTLIAAEQQNRKSLGCEKDIERYKTSLFEINKLGFKVNQNAKVFENKK